MKKSKLLFILMSVLLLFSTISIVSACKDKNAPKYLGFDALSELPTIAQTTSYNNESKVKALSEQTPEDEPNSDLIVHEPANCYTLPKQQFYLSIALDNPNEYEILSITVNNIKYQTFQFDENSTSNNIILKITASETPGIHEYTLNSVKYVTGDTIGSVSLVAKLNNESVSTNVRVGVKADVYTNTFEVASSGKHFNQYGLNLDNQTTYWYAEKQKTDNEVIMNFTLSDDSNCIENSNGFIEIIFTSFDSEDILFSQELVVGDNAITLPSSLYAQYINQDGYSFLKVYVEGYFDDYFSEETFHNKLFTRYFIDQTNEYGLIIFI